LQVATGRTRTSGGGAGHTEHAQQAQHDGMVDHVQLLTGRAPTANPQRGPSRPDAIDAEEDWLAGGEEGLVRAQPAGVGPLASSHIQQQQQQSHQLQRQQEDNQHYLHQQQQQHLQATGGRTPAMPAARAPAAPGGPADPPPSSYKTPGHQLRALFHGGGTPGSHPATGRGTAGAAAGKGGSTPGTGPWTAGTATGNSALTGAAGLAEGGSAGKGAAPGGGMLLQRAFVAALAPVSRSAQAPRQRGGAAGAGGGGLYGRLQVRGIGRGHNAPRGNDLGIDTILAGGQHQFT
jgi:hypothetical protein